MNILHGLLWLFCPADVKKTNNHGFNVALVSIKIKTRDSHFYLWGVYSHDAVFVSAAINAYEVLRETEYCVRHFKKDR